MFLGYSWEKYERLIKTDSQCSLVEGDIILIRNYSEIKDSDSSWLTPYIHLVRHTQQL